MEDFISSVIASSITIFVIMDPFPSIMPFLTRTKNHTAGERNRCADKAIAIAGALAIFFLLVGPTLLGYLHITLADFKVAGGIILLLLGIETVLGISIGDHNKTNKKEDLNDIAVLIATPLLTGPGLVTSLIILAKDNGLLITISALSLALLCSWIILRNSIIIRKITGEQIIQIMAKVIGLILLALGVAYIKTGLLG